VCSENERKKEIHRNNRRFCNSLDYRTKPSAILEYMNNEKRQVGLASEMPKEP
jgi:hypothetical protein